MIKARISRVLGLEAAEPAPLETRKTPSGLRLPTLDERVRLYLLAVHGERDFTNEEYSNARGLLLSAMAAEIAAKAETRLTEETGESARSAPRAIDTPATIAILASATPSRELGRNFDDLIHDTLPSFSEESAASEDIYARRGPASIATASSEAMSVTRGGLSKTTPRRRLATRFSICAVAIAASVGALVVVKIPLTAWFAGESSTGESRTAVQPSPPEWSGRVFLEPRQMESTRAPLGAAPSGVVQTPTALPSEPDPVWAAVQRGQELITAGKISEARLVLKMAAEAGNAPAALALGTTYDPIEFEKLGVHDSTPDVTMARTWYQKAKDLGSTEAVGRLESLAGRNGQPR
jgi:hypothetical protein